MAGNCEPGGFVNSTVKLHIYSAIHKAASLMAPGHSMILPGTVPETPISRKWSWQLE